MKLTKRGKRVRAVLILIVLIISVQFFTTHHRVYGECHMSDVGQLCKLIKWERN